MEYIKPWFDDEGREASEGFTSPVVFPYRTPTAYSTIMIVSTAAVRGANCWFSRGEANMGR